MTTYVEHGFSRAEGYVGHSVSRARARAGSGFGRIGSAERHVGFGLSRIVLNGRRAVRIAVVAVATLLGAVAATAVAQDMPRLPGSIKMMRTGDSPGQVVFVHGTHVDAARPACTTCHPREFRILKASPRRAPVTHAEMDKGRYCGTCHNGTKAFALDDCAACHRD